MTAATDVGDAPAQTIRQAVADHEVRLDSLEKWRERTKVYESLLRWTLATALGTLMVTVINILLLLGMGRS